MRPSVVRLSSLPCSRHPSFVLRHRGLIGMHDAFDLIAAEYEHKRLTVLAWSAQVHLKTTARFKLRLRRMMCLKAMISWLAIGSSDAAF